MINLSHHKRAVGAAIERQGFTPSERWPGGSVEPEERRADGGPTFGNLEGVERWDTWVTESLLTGIRAFERGEFRLAMRCLCQVARYEAKGSGFDVVTRDAYEALSAAVQERLPS